MVDLEAPSEEEQQQEQQEQQEEELADEDATAEGEDQDQDQQDDEHRFPFGSVTWARTYLTSVGMLTVKCRNGESPLPDLRPQPIASGLR